MRRKPFRRGVIAFAIVMTVLPLVLSSPAGAIDGLPLLCRGAGVLSYTDNGPTGPDDISLAGGTGLCSGDFSGAYTLNFSGSGTVDTLGFCEGGGPGLPVVTNLSLSMDLDLVSTGTGEVRHIDETWGAPVSTFPLITPFLATDDGLGDTLVGGGYVATRIFLQCAPEGRPASTVFRIRLS